MTAPKETGPDPKVDDTDPVEPPEGTDPVGDPDGGKDADPLGDAGKRAIDAMKRERNAARKELADAQKKIKEFSDKDKTELQRLQESAEESKSRAAKAEVTHRKLQTAFDRAPEGASRDAIKAVAKRLAGETEEEMEADADELFALLVPAAAADDTKKTLPGKPTEKLSGGGDPGEEPEEKDPRKLADLIGRH